MSSPTSPKRAKIVPTQGNSARTAQNEEMALNSSSDEIRIDIFSELCKRNIEHAIDIIVENADFQSIVRMRQVSKEWKRIIDSYDNPWQMMLMKRLKDNPDFAAASDLLDWTKYIMSSDPKHKERVKYIAYIGTYITEKQRILRRSGDDENAFSLELNLSGAKVKEMGGWVHVARHGKISAWDLSCHDGVQGQGPRKVFTPPRLDYEDEYLERAQPIYCVDGIDSEITCFTSNSELEPWQEMKLVAAGCFYEMIQACQAPERVENCWIVWDFDTGAVIHKMETDAMAIDSIGLDSKHLVTLGIMYANNDFYGHHEAMNVSIFDTNFELIKDYEDRECGFVMGDSKIFVEAGDRFYKFAHDNDHFTETVREREFDSYAHINQISGNLALESSNFARFFHSPGRKITSERSKGRFELLDIQDFANFKGLVYKGFVEGKMRESPSLSLLRNGLLLLSDQVMPFPLEDLLGGYRRGIFDVKCDKLEGVHHMTSSEEKTRESDGEGYIQLMEIKSSPTYIVTRQVTGRGQGSALKIIDMRKVKPKRPC